MESLRSAFLKNKIDLIPYFEIHYSTFVIRYSLFSAFPIPHSTFRLRKTLSSYQVPMQILPGRFQVCDGNPNDGLLPRSIYNQVGTIGDGTDAGQR
jgi:hypothetical protein